MTKHNDKTNRFNFSTRMLTTLPSLFALCLIFATVPAHASKPVYGGDNLTGIAAAPNGGFWVQIDGFYNGGTASKTVAIEGAPQFEDVPYRGSIASILGQAGYWVVSPTGDIYARGTAPAICSGHLSSCSGFPTNPGFQDSIVALAATPDGQGFWAVSYNGKLWTAGTAQPFGDVTNESNPPTGIVATPSGRGYYIVIEDGGVYSFGDAVFHGSTGGNKPGGHSATGLAASLDASGKVNGYWMVADDGGLFTFGDAPFLGSTGGNNGGSYVTSIVARHGGQAYAWVHGNGWVGFSRTIASVTITSNEYGTVIDVPNGSTEPGAVLALVAGNGATDEQWNVWPTGPDGAFAQLVNVNSGLCAALDGNRINGSIIQSPCKGKGQGWNSQLWKLVTTSSGTTQLYSVSHSSYYLAGTPDGGLQLISSTLRNSGWTLTKVQ